MEHIESEGQEVDARRGELVQKEFDFENEKKQLAVTIENLEHQNSELVKDNDKMTGQLSKSYTRNLDLELQVEDMATEINRLGTFENHIKQLLIDTGLNVHCLTV